MPEDDVRLCPTCAYGAQRAPLGKRPRALWKCWLTGREYSGASLRALGLSCLCWTEGHRAKELHKEQARG